MARKGFIRIGMFVVWLALLVAAAPNTAQARTLATTATVADGALTVEAYLQNEDAETTTVKPTDYIFVLDQSQWMNGTDGAQRAAIIESLNSFVDHLETPTYGENRFAIAGYGRINVGGNGDPYDATLYPGVKPSNNTSLNTGYYTASGFVSYKGWTEVSNYASSALPTVPAAQFANATYDSLFMSASDAQTVLDPSTMNAWYAGASRMDAGLALAEQLADIARTHDPDRNLMVVFVSSSLPILHRSDGDRTYVRAEAVTEASRVLKGDGATILALTNYHPSNRVITSGLADTEENFDAVMSQLCSKTDYYFPIKDNASLARVLSNLVTEVSIVSAGDAAVPATITAETFDEADGASVTWDQYAAGKQDAYARAYAAVSLYDFTGFDAAGAPVFSAEPRLTYQVPVSDVISNGEFSFSTDLVPVPDRATFASGDVPYGYKVVVTIDQPHTVTYAWGTGTPVPSDATLPAPDVLLEGEELFAPTPASDNEHFRFLGWYTDPACTTPVAAGATYDEDVTLYGKWEKDVVVKYYWNYEDGGYEYFDSEEVIEPGATPDLFDPEELDGKVFAGWYTDKDCTAPYVPGPATQDLDLYAKWVDAAAPDEPGTDEPGDEGSAPDDEGTSPAEPGDEKEPSDEGSETAPGDETDKDAAAGTGSSSIDVKPVVKPVTQGTPTPETGVETLPVVSVALAGALAAGVSIGMRRKR